MRPLRVLSLNIWNRQGPWEKRRKLLERGLAELAPDIIGLQEVIHGKDGGLSCQAHELGELWKAHGGPEEFHIAFGPAWSYESGDQFGNAILSRYPLTDQQVFQLPTSDARSTVFARVMTPSGPLPFFCTHLSWRFEEGLLREDQVVAIAEKVKATVRDGDLPAVLVGDLNAAPDAAEIRYLRGLQSIGRTTIHFTDCFERVGQGPGYTFDPPANPHADLTYEAPRRIDYVLVRGPDDSGRGMPLSARVVMTEVVEDQGERVAPSDHFGVLAEIRF
ncbi:MAG: endonuclease/exonuclease/phosphatase family protein [Polyangiaceae bacterium]